MPRYKHVHYGLIARAIKVAVNRWGPKPLRELVEIAEQAAHVTMDPSVIKTKLGDMVVTKTEIQGDVVVAKDWVYPSVAPRQRL